MSTIEHAEAVNAIAALAKEGCKVELIEISTEGLGAGLPAKVPALLDTKEGCVTQVLDVIERHRQAPAFARGTAKATTLASFQDLVNRHKGTDSVIFARTTWPDPALTAVIDYHTTDHKPGRLQHRVEYKFPITPEFSTWVGLNGKPMEQAAFAAFLEEHAAELAEALPEEAKLYEPLFKERFATPADLIDLSRHLEVFVSAKVKQGTRLSSGERQIEFTEEHHNGKGEKVDIPGLFMLSVAAFVDGPAVRIPARLRYRISGGAISWAYQLYRWEDALRERVKDDLECAAAETSLPAFEGTPES